MPEPTAKRETPRGVGLGPLPFDNTFAYELEGFYVPWEGEPVPAPLVGFDQPPAFDPTQPEPVHAYDLDQSIPDEFD